MSYPEWMATGFSLLYLIYAIKNKSIAFVFGIIGSAIWAYVSFHYYRLFYDAGVQVFYVIMSIYGLYKWKEGNEDSSETPITKLSFSIHAIIIAIGLVISVFLSKFSDMIEDINYAGLDAFTTIFLMIGTLLLVERRLYSWTYLVIADLVYIYIYGQSQAWLFMGMMIIYSIFGVVGFYNWKKIYEEQT